MSIAAASGPTNWTNVPLCGRLSIRDLVLIGVVAPYLYLSRQAQGFSLFIQIGKEKRG